MCVTVSGYTLKWASTSETRSKWYAMKGASVAKTMQYRFQIINMTELRERESTGGSSYSGKEGVKRYRYLPLPPSSSPCLPHSSSHPPLSSFLPPILTFLRDTPLYFLYNSFNPFLFPLSSPSFLTHSLSSPSLSILLASLSLLLPCFASFYLTLPYLILPYHTLPYEYCIVYVYMYICVCVCCIIQSGNERVCSRECRGHGGVGVTCAGLH